MESTLRLHQTTLGKKAIMALSGLAMVGFLVAHMLGNMTVYIGPEAMYEYAKGLRAIPGLLWVARLGLVAAVGSHIWAAYQLNKLNESARPRSYAVATFQQTSFAARTMFMTGNIMLFYIVFHIAHLTFGAGVANYDQYNVYNNFVYGFQNTPVALLYIVGNLAVGWHVFHGFWSMFQTLGANHPRYNHLRKQAATAIAVVIAGANVTFPLSVMFGFLQPTTMTFPAW